MRDKKKMIKRILTSNDWRIRYILATPIGRALPDKIYVRLKYRAFLHKKIDLQTPFTFNEKLQWLKLYDRNPLYTTLVDKYAVRQYIKEKIGEEYLIPLIGGPWKSVDEIPFDTLPNQFVLKTTHDSGGVVICNDKKNFDVDAAKRKLHKSLKNNFYYSGREWPYKNVPPQIIAEQYLENNGKGLIDYKFFCFDGIVKFLYVSQGLENHETAQISFVDLEWKEEAFKRKDYKAFQNLPDKPSRFHDMLEIASKLCQGFSFIRVDLYEVNNKIYFSELTLYPCSGFLPFEPDEYDAIIGDMLHLPEKKK